MLARTSLLRSPAVPVLLGLLVLLLAACVGPLPERSSGPSGPAYDPAADPLVNPPTLTEPYPFDRPEAVARDDTLVRYMLGDPRTLNPIFAIFWEDYYLSSALFQALTTRNADMTTVWNQTMVEEGIMADDFMSARVRIRPGLTWHDGKPWTMHDLKFTYDAVASDDVPAAMYKHDVDQIERIEVIDDLTVEFFFKDALVTNMLAMRVPPIPRHIWNNPEERANDPTLRSSEYFNHHAREEVIGSGPYKFVSWTQTDRIVVDRWDEFPDAARVAPFKRVIYRPQSDRNLGLLLFKKGELDEYWFTPQQFATQSNDAEFERLGVKGWAPARRIARIGWNQDGSNPFFGDVRVRRAMTHAYDQKRVIRDVTYGVYLETDQLWDKNHMGYNPDVPKYPFDLERAAALLDEAGWLSDPDDGWRYQEIDGRRIKFSFELEIAQTFADGGQDGRYLPRGPAQHRRRADASRVRERDPRAAPAGARVPGPRRRRRGDDGPGPVVDPPALHELRQRPQLRRLQERAGRRTPGTRPARVRPRGPRRDLPRTGTRGRRGPAVHDDVELLRDQGLQQAPPRRRVRALRRLPVPADPAPRQQLVDQPRLVDPPRGRSFG